MLRSILPKLSLPRLLWNWKQGRHLASDSTRSFQPEKKELVKENKGIKKEGWVPHPRTGIFYPQGQEWVMNDIPEGAGSFEHTYWLRNSEGEDMDHNLHKGM